MQVERGTGDPDVEGKRVTNVPELRSTAWVCMRNPSRHTGSSSSARSIDENVSSLASTIVTEPLPSTSSVSSGPMKAAVSSSRPMPIANGL